ncbi:ComEC/Rec2 family competence protein [Leptospira sp. 96542]|nr:ComEC/Rec2 family competence protein [Leptospira sp. 96542]
MGKNINFIPSSPLAALASGVTIACVFLKTDTNLPGSQFFLLCLGVIFLLILLLPVPMKTIRKTKVLLFVFGFLLIILFGKRESPPRIKIIHPGFNQTIIKLLETSPLSKMEQKIVLGFVTGSSKGLPKEFYKQSQMAGVLHLFAASGLHLGIFMGSIFIVFSFLFPNYKIIPMILSLSLGLVYLYLLDFPVSFFRAYVFGFYTLFGNFFFRKVFPMDLLVITSAFIILFFYSDFLSVGYLLSFAAVFGIFFIKPCLDEIFFPKSKNFIKESFHLTLSCSIATFPFMVFIFKSFSFGGIWINFLIVPLASVLLPLIYLTFFLHGLFLPFLSEYFTTLLWLPTSWMMAFFLFVFKTLVQLETAYIVWEEIPKIQIYILLFLSFLLFFSQKLKHKISKKIPFLPYIGILIFFIFSYFTHKTHKDWFKFRHGGGAYVYQNNLYIYGYCFPGFKIYVPEIQKLKIETIHIESESCLKEVLSFQKVFPKTKLIGYDEKLKLWLGSYKSLELKDDTKLMGFDLSNSLSILRFDGNPKSVPKLLKTVKQHSKEFDPHWKGYIILDFPKWKEKEAKDWKTYQKLLGISSGWKMISVEESIEIPLQHQNGDPKVL